MELQFLLAFSQAKDNKFMTIYEYIYFLVDDKCGVANFESFYDTSHGNLWLYYLYQSPRPIDFIIKDNNMATLGLKFWGRSKQMDLLTILRPWKFTFPAC